MDCQALHIWHHIWFQFGENIPGTGEKAARDIRDLFLRRIFRSFGGFIQRLDSEDAMAGLYEVQIWTRAVNHDDSALNPLWLFVICVLGVEAYTITIEPGEPSEDCFRDRFFMSFHGVEPEDWSSGSDLVDDDVSDISIDSIYYH